jgi:hypothetical protein
MTTGHFADNDNWFDGISDGPVAATIELPGGTVAHATAWVINSTKCASAPPTSRTAGCSVHRGITFIGFDAVCVSARGRAIGTILSAHAFSVPNAWVPLEEAHTRCFDIPDSTYGRLLGLFSRIDIGILCRLCLTCAEII